MKTLHQELAEEFSRNPKGRPNGWCLDDFMEFKYRQSYTLGEKIDMRDRLDGEIVIVDVSFVKGEARYRISYKGLVENELVPDHELWGYINND